MFEGVSTSLHIVLVEPEIHGNTGNIARTCGCTGLSLHLVQPIGFSLDDRLLRRAGVDYWHLVNLQIHNSFDELVAANPGARLFLTTPDTATRHTDVTYRPGDFLVFGKESTGLSDFILENYDATHIRLPMRPGARSLNLANSVAVVAYEALRQLDYPNLQ